MLAYLEIVGGDGIPHPTHPMLLLCLHPIGGGSDIALGDRIGEDTLFLLRIVQTCRGADMQILVRLNIQKGVAEKAPIGVAIVLVAVKTGNGVLTVGVAADRACVVARGGIDRQRGIELQSVLQDTAWGLHLARTVECEIFANRDTVVQERVVGIGTSRETVKIGMLDDAEILVVVDREITLAVLAALTDGEVVLLHDTRAGDLVEPIGVSGRGSAGIVKVLAHREAVENRGSGCVVRPVVGVAQTIGIRVEAIVDIRLPQALTELLGVEHRHTVDIAGDGDTGIKIDLDTTLLAFLGGNDNDTICGTRTIDAGGRSVLEHLNGLDVVAVEFVHAALGGDTIDDIERVVVVERTDTTDAHGGRTGRRAVGGDIQTRHLALHGLHGVVLVLLFEVAHTDDTDRSCKVGLALGGVTGDD